MRALLPILFALLALLPVGPARAAEIIEDFFATIEVQPDGDLIVSESVTVRAEGVQIRRGIYRDFPLQFEDADGRLRQVSFELLGVYREGRPEAHHTRRSSRGIRIYAGSENTLIPTGSHRYEFRYRTGRQLREVDGATELNWNVTGNEWAFPIAAARAIVSLPGKVEPARWTAYTGRFGERGEDYEWRIREGRLEVRTTRRLAPGEGLTLVAELPPGLVAPPTQAQKLEYLYLDNRLYLLGGFGLAVVALFYLLVWRAVGRDPPKGIVIPLFEPPPGVSPALAGYVRHWGWSRDWREFTAAALSLAVKGLIVFDDSGNGLILKRRQSGDAAPALPSGERALLAWIDGAGGVASIDKANGERLATGLKAFRSAIEAENRNRFFKRNLGWFGAGLALSLAAIWVVFASSDLVGGDSGLLGFTVMLGVIVGTSILRGLRGAMPGQAVRRVIAVAIQVGLLGFIGVVILVLQGNAGIVDAAGFGRGLLDTVRENLFPLALILGFGLLNGSFYYLLRAPTAAGRPVMDQIEGLELYLRTAESARLNLQGAPEITTERFEKLLPYAVALGAEKPWSEAFQAALERARPSQASDPVYRPAWHRGTDWSGRSLAQGLAGSVAAAQGAFASSMPAPKSSSGFSGGGGSGGGGGGGGGGGW